MEFSSGFSLATERNAERLREAEQERLRRLARAGRKPRVIRLDPERPSALRRLLWFRAGRELTNPAWPFGRLG